MEPQQLNPQHVALVQGSFALVAPIADQAAVIFYDELFRLDPTLRGLFSDDMTEQRRKLMMMLGMAVNGLGNWGQVLPVLRELGRKHVAYGAVQADYDTVGAALIAALAAGLGEAFTRETRQAWLACYGILSSEMLAAADGPLLEQEMRPRTRG